MKKIIILAIFAIFGGISPLFAAGTVPGEFVEGEVLAVLQAPSLSASNAALFNESVASSAESVAASVGAQAVQTYGAIAIRSGKNIVHIRSEQKSTEELIAELKTLPEVIDAWPNYISRASLVPNDPNFGKQWGLRYINAAEAWDISTGKAEIFVAVIDSGIDYLHEDLAANIARDLDGNLGFDAVNKDADPMDDHGHGTHVAGIIGAVGNNGIGTTGVNWKVGLLAVKVLDSEIRGNDAGIIAGLNYVLEQKERGLDIRVANMSLTGWREPILDQEKNPYGAAIKALSDAGILLVVAAGNEKQNLDSPEEYYDWANFRKVDLRGKRPYPACFTFENMITVSSMAGDRAPSSFTNFSPNFVHLAAPGTDIPSTWPGNGYKTISGTSMATPHVAGTAALIAARFPRKSAPEIKARIVGNTIMNYSWEGRVVYGGYLDAAAALGEPDPAVPVTAISLYPESLKFSGKTSLAVTATVRPVNADKKDIIWSSDNPSVAVVSQTDTGATITSVSDGKATIKAHALGGGASASVSVTVTGAGAAVMGGGGGCSVAVPPTWTSLLFFGPFLFLRR